MVFAEEHDARKEMRGPRQVLPVAALVLAVLPAAAAAQDSFPTADATPSMTLPSVDVIGATPLLGSGVDRDKVPAQTHVLTDQDISRNGYPQALRALNEDVPGSPSMPPRAIRFSPTCSTRLSCLAAAR
jgi:hypothetical protein